MAAPGRDGDAPLLLACQLTRRGASVALRREQDRAGAVRQQTAEIDVSPFADPAEMAPTAAG
jgi:hypothetical protein